MALKTALFVAGTFGVLGLVLGCSKKETPEHRTAPWLAHPSSSAILAAAPRSFHFVPGSHVRFSATGRKGKVAGTAPVSAGALRLDPRDLTSASATVDVDLTQLTIDTQVPDGIDIGGSSPSALALQWLELGAEVPAERRAQFRLGRFELSSVDNLSAPGLDLTATTKHARVRAAATGTLLLHGFRAPVRVEVVLEPLKVPTGAPPRLSIRSAGPFVEALAPHDIAARGPSGTIDALGAARAADWVGKSVRIEFDLVAEAEPGAAK